MDYEYDEEPLEGRVLWGRIAVYGMAFVLVFLLGSCFGARGAPSDDEVQELSERVRDLASENAVLEQQLDATSGGAGAEQPAPTETGAGDTGSGEQPADAAEATEPAGGEGADQDQTEAASGETQVYRVESGDNLYGIAERVYGDGSQWRIIADENGLDASNPLTVGQELRIPPRD